MIDDHQIAHHAHFVAMRGRIIERDARYDPWIFGIRNIDNRGAEVLLIGNMADIGVPARDGDLSRAGQIEMTQTPHVARQSAVRSFHFRHRLIIQFGARGFHDRRPFGNLAFNVGLKFLRRVADNVDAQLAEGIAYAEVIERFDRRIVQCRYDLR